MKLAIISVTNQGALLGDALAEKLAKLGKKADVFAKAGRNPMNSISYDLLSKLISDIFSKYDGFLFIMATGIVVRVIAPHISDKRVDPAIVVMGDNGEHVISLLSGHIGGANELAHLIAEISDAEPVITTATDLAQKPAADMLAVKLNLKIEPFTQLKAINSAIVNNDTVKFFLDKTLNNQNRYEQEAVKQGVVFKDLSLLPNEEYDAAVIITDQLLPINKNQLYLRPLTLAVGIGCRRNTSKEEILAAIKDACTQIGHSINSISIIGSTIVKQDEKGLLSVIQQLNVPSIFFVNEQLQECIETYQLEESNFVKKKIGVGNVCAAAAILAGQSNKLLLPKTKYKNVTVAIAPVK
ncbi:cobalt-precorrin 5A hydrolase [Pelosinus propionicus]|uniref:Cobalt-precorrin 5A acetaldehyde-lyase n=1 Tax=Pelosinus propionicus DSM 13327 TaxID=1123291 RepID=A0A1I4H8R2_9FIRM|nr:cobalt-precorrin 5A hydrolase [Pelosinus propionicus]SFL38555.1 cobalt-precorrin 5A acetaldehyde-lyase [Pelosinus propionicus DSM 13327]